MTAEYGDLKKELWLRQRNNGEIQWETKDGRKIPIKDMSDEHLINTIRMLDRVEIIKDLYFDEGW